MFEGSGRAEWGAFIDSAWSLKTGVFQIATKWSNWYFSKDGFLENWHVEEIGSDLFILLKICVLVGRLYHPSNKEYTVRNSGGGLWRLLAR